MSASALFRAREGLEEADVIVTNHDLVLSDLRLGGGVILPAPEDSLYVFDEGHQLPPNASIILRCAFTRVEHCRACVTASVGSRRRGRVG